MVSANSKMADTRSTLLECSVKIRQGRKWKSRWCVLTRQSPVSEEVILRFYKDQNALLMNKELSREHVCVSPHNYCGLEYGLRYPKNVYVLTIILMDSVILLSFPTHERLLDWYHKIKHTVPAAPVAEFKSRVILPRKGKMPAGQASLYFYSNHFAITPDTPLRLIGAWNLSMVIRYGTFEGGFAFVVRSNKGSVNHLLLLRDPDYIKNHFDAAMQVHLPIRWSVHSETNPATRVDFHSTISPERERLLNEINRDPDKLEVTTSVESDVKNGNQSEESEAQELLLTNSADRNSNTQKQSDMEVITQNTAAEDIEMTQFDSVRTAQSEIDGESNASLLRAETAFDEMMLYSPQKNTPIREQEYEIMASFDHYRSSLHEPYDSGSQIHLSHNGEGSGVSGIEHLVNMDRFKLNLKCEEREYVNLPSPKTTLQRNTRQLRYLKRATYASLPLYVTDVHDFSPPSSPPPPPPVSSKLNDLSWDKSSLQRLNPGLEFTDSRAPESLGSLSHNSDPVEIPIPFAHETLVEPQGPITKLKVHSEQSQDKDCVGSGSEYSDSSRYSSATSSRHNSFDREPPPVPPKSVNRRLPSIEALLSSGNFRHDMLSIDLSKLPSDTSSSPPIRSYPPPILPPKPDHLKGRPLREPPSPQSPSSRPPFLPPRKRCNTVPSFATTDGNTELVESKDEGDDGYLLMKPVYEGKLKAMHTRSKSVPDEEALQFRTLPSPLRSWTTLPGSQPLRTQVPGVESTSPHLEFIPHSPIHDAAEMRMQMPRRSATIGGYGSRISRSPSFTARKPSLRRGSSQRRSISHSQTPRQRTTDISLSGGPVPRRRRSDKYGSLDHGTMSLDRSKLQNFQESGQDLPESPTAATPFLESEFQELKADLDKFAGPLSLSPPSSINSPSGSHQLTPASSVESINT
ncbi:uncharacterized protein [Diadema setosum]|uniref:uncharacterized protein n=1 Tax=Diadema setosum TaxID=31175 RepID=UPI003B3B88BE